ncbi:hypothetical protein [Lelliottia sp. RWM.1]|uniref:hypothetical protein n=1 Tax=Lelliottia sp. RWM.1 TaxID=2663242 RepID=UPI001EF02525|nr:hypothetical protein [Lelliottia sp. RWM.1]
MSSSQPLAHALTWSINLQRLQWNAQQGRNQAVMLPAEFAFDTESVYIRWDDEGNVILTARLEKE